MTTKTTKKYDYSTIINLAKVDRVSKTFGRPVDPLTPAEEEMFRVLAKVCVEKQASQIFFYTRFKELYDQNNLNELKKFFPGSEPSLAPTRFRQFLNDAVKELSQQIKKNEEKDDKATFEDGSIEVDVRHAK